MPATGSSTSSSRTSVSTVALAAALAAALAVAAAAAVAEPAAAAAAAVAVVVAVVVGAVVARTAVVVAVVRAVVRPVVGRGCRCRLSRGCRCGCRRGRPPRLSARLSARLSDAVVGAVAAAAVVGAVVAAPPLAPRRTARVGRSVGGRIRAGGSVGGRGGLGRGAVVLGAGAADAADGHRPRPRRAASAARRWCDSACLARALAATAAAVSVAGVVAGRDVGSVAVGRRRPRRPGRRRRWWRASGPVRPRACWPRGDDGWARQGRRRSRWWPGRAGAGRRVRQRELRGGARARLALLDRGDEIALSHAGDVGDVQLPRQLAEFRQHHAGEAPLAGCGGADELGLAQGCPS